MIKEILDSLTDNIKTKTSNPFFGTLILVWVAKNWNLFYSLFNFDNGATLIQKREFINSHFTNLPFIETLLWCVLETFVILIISYFLINLSRLIINLYEKKLTPLIYKWTDENSIVLKTVYITSENERRRLEKRLDEEREAKLRLQEDYDKLEKRIAEILAEKNSNLENKETENDKNLENQDTVRTLNNEKVRLIYRKLQEENMLEDFENIASSILNGDAIPKSYKNIAKLSSIGLIVPGKYFGGQDLYNYSLSEAGRVLHEGIQLRLLE